MKLFFIPLLLWLLAMTHSAQAEVINKDGYDVRVLGAALTQRTIEITNYDSLDTVDYRSCIEVARTPQYVHGHHSYDAFTLNCTSALESKLNAPALNELELYVNFGPNNDVILSSMPLTKVANTVIYTASPVDALKQSTGIGFHYLWSSKFIPKNRLQTVGSSELLRGGQAAVHKFVGLHKQRQDTFTQFKPFMAFDTANDVYHVWEDVSPRHGHPNVYLPIDGIMGSGNYNLIFHNRDRFQFLDVITSNELVALPKFNAPIWPNRRYGFRSPTDHHYPC